MKYDLIIFDCDGVLIDSEPISNRTLVEGLAQLGLHMTYEESISTFTGKSLSANKHYIEERLGKSLPSDFSAKLEDIALQKFKTELNAISGIHKAIEKIAMPMCVASSSNHVWIRRGLELIGLLPRFENKIFSASEVKHGKPAPDIFLHAAKQMGFAPQQCAVVEDSPTGVQAGLNADMTVFGYTGTFGHELLTQAGAHYIFDDMEQLPEILESNTKMDSITKKS